MSKPIRRKQINTNNGPIDLFNFLIFKTLRESIRKSVEQAEVKVNQIVIDGETENQTVPELVEVELVVHSEDDEFLDVNQTQTLFVEQTEATKLLNKH